jgi:hypothetical protein
MSSYDGILRRDCFMMALADTRVARERYEWEYAFAVKQLQEREARIMDELQP